MRALNEYPDTLASIAWVVLHVRKRGLTRFGTPVAATGTAPFDDDPEDDPDESLLLPPFYHGLEHAAAGVTVEDAVGQWAACGALRRREDEVARYLHDLDDERIDLAGGSDGDRPTASNHARGGKTVARHRHRNPTRRRCWSHRLLHRLCDGARECEFQQARPLSDAAGAPPPTGPGTGAGDETAGAVPAATSSDGTNNSSNDNNSEIAATLAQWRVMSDEVSDFARRVVGGVAAVVSGGDGDRSEDDASEPFEDAAVRSMLHLCCAAEASGTGALYNALDALVPHERVARLDPAVGALTTPGFADFLEAFAGEVLDYELGVGGDEERGEEAWASTSTARCGWTAACTEAIIGACPSGGTASKEAGWRGEEGGTSYETSATRSLAEPASTCTGLRGTAAHEGRMLLRVTHTPQDDLTTRIPSRRTLSFATGVFDGVLYDPTACPALLAFEARGGAGAEVLLMRAPPPPPAPDLGGHSTPPRGAWYIPRLPLAARLAGLGELYHPRTKVRAAPPRAAGAGSPSSIIGLYGVVAAGQVPGCLVAGCVVAGDGDDIDADVDGATPTDAPVPTTPPANPSSDREAILGAGGQPGSVRMEAVGNTRDTVRGVAGDMCPHPCLQDTAPITRFTVPRAGDGIAYRMLDPGLPRDNGNPRPCAPVGGPRNRVEEGASSLRRRHPLLADTACGLMRPLARDIVRLALEGNAAAAAAARIDETPARIDVDGGRGAVASPPPRFNITNVITRLAVMPWQLRGPTVQSLLADAEKEYEAIGSVGRRANLLHDCLRRLHPPAIGIATFNVNCGHGAARGGVWDVVRRAEVTILTEVHAGSLDWLEVGLAEANDPLPHGRRAATENQRPHVTYSFEGGGEASCGFGSAVVDTTGACEFVARLRINDERSSVCVRRGRVYIVAVHLDHMREAVRLGELECVMEWLAALGVVTAPHCLVGDFNALVAADYTPSALAAVAAHRAKSDWEPVRFDVAESLARRGYVLAGAGDATPTCWAGTRVDHVWCKGCTPVDDFYHVLPSAGTGTGAGAADHKAVTAVVTPG